MAQAVCQSACLLCTMGVGPSILNVVPPKQTLTSSLNMATIMHCEPFVNITPFPGCISPANPAVVPPFVPVGPCLPVIPEPWTPGSPTVLLEGEPALNNTSTLMCAYGGVISVIFPGQVTTLIP